MQKSTVGDNNSEMSIKKQEPNVWQKCQMRQNKQINAHKKIFFFSFSLTADRAQTGSLSRLPVSYFCAHLYICCVFFCCP